MQVLSSTILMIAAAFHWAYEGESMKSKTELPKTVFKDPVDLLFVGPYCGSVLS
jgi:hypothetical protein